MKIVFEGSELKEGLIKVSLDGGFTFADYEIASVKESGIPLDDSQRYDKIKIKGPANILKSLDIVSNVKVEGKQASEESDYEEVLYYGWEDGSFTKDGSDAIYRLAPDGKMYDTGYIFLGVGGGGAHGLMIGNPDGSLRSKSDDQQLDELNVVVKEPKKTNFYSWSILKGRITESDGSLINEGSYSGTLYTTKNPEEENGPFIFYSIDDNDEVSIEFIQKSVGREFPFTEFKGQYCIYNSYGCIMFYGGVGKQLNLEMASVPVQTVKTPLYSKKDNNYYAWQTPSGLVCYTRTLKSFEDLEVFSLVPEDIVSPETYIPKFKSATGEATMFGTGAIFTWQNGTLHYYNDMVKGGPEEYDLQRYKDGDYYLPPIITINPPTWFDRTDPLNSIVPKDEYIMAEGHQRLGNGLSSLRDVWFDGGNFFIRTTDDFDCIYSGLEITEQGVVHYITGGRLGWSDSH